MIEYPIRHESNVLSESESLDKFPLKKKMSACVLRVCKLDSVSITIGPLKLGFTERQRNYLLLPLYC